MLGTTVTRRYHFECAHFLPHVADDHKCKRMHGHNYEMEVTIAGELKPDGFIIDFWDLDKIVEPLVAFVDHQVLNATPGLENPTAENIANWFFIRISGLLGEDLHVMKVQIWETKDCSAIVEVV
jgi:6-pyruvoyltetrahydropterin/6-carboxytetrahydropterin synthase